MATFLNLDREKIAEADKHEQRKANTLGADRPVTEEPFANSEISFTEDIFSKTPSVDTDFAGPDYGDWPDGNTASRRSMVRLHPLITSGMNGPNSIQTFVIVSSPPASDDPVDIEAVRIKHLVPPDLSIGRADAAEPDTTKRGFQLALFPAYQTGTGLDGYDGYGAIPITADPSATEGIGDNGRWTVDYANGIVRFSEPPLNGPTGIVNPFNVFGNINGYEDSSERGRITMFATFYQYTGPRGSGGNVVTVGDGVDSFGTFYGKTSEAMQTAVDSLEMLGGTVYLKEGNYEYDTDVHVPSGVRIVGLSKRASITRPADSPAFTIYDSNTSISGLKIMTVAPGANQTVQRADIEISTTSSSQTVENVSIYNNELYASHDAYGIGFSPKHLNSTFKNVRIEKNTFGCPHFENPIFIGEGFDDGTVSLENIAIKDNNFVVAESAVDGYALYFTGESIEDIREIHITNNYMSGLVDVGIDVGVAIENMYLANNSEFRDMFVNGMSGSIIKHNVFTNAKIDGYVADSRFSDNIFNSFLLSEAASDFNFSGNTCFGNVIFKADSSEVDWELVNVSIANNKIHQDLHVSHGLIGSGTHKVRDLTIENNSITMSLTFASDTNFGIGELEYSGLRVIDNVIGEYGTTNPVSIKLGDGAQDYVYLRNCVFSNNTLHGDIIAYNRVYTNTNSSVWFKENSLVYSKGIYLHSRRWDNVEISGNKLTEIDLLSDPVTSADSQSLSGVVIKNNTLFGTAQITLNDLTAPTDFALSSCVIEDNNFVDNGSVSIMESASSTNTYTFTNLSVSRNNLGSGSINIGGTLDSDSAFNDLFVKDNWASGGISVAGAVTTRGDISGNTTVGSLAGDLIFNGTLISAMVEGNHVDDMTMLNIGNVLVSNNLCSGSFSLSGTSYYSDIINNSFDDNLSLNDLARYTKLNDNKVDGYTAIADFEDGTINSNNFGDVGIGLINITTFSDNSVGAIYGGTWQNSTFSGNSLGRIHDGTWQNSAFTGNTTTDQFDSTSFSESTFTGNVIGGVLTIPTILNSRFENNVIGTSTTSGDVFVVSDTFSGSSISNNTLIEQTGYGGNGGLNISASTVENSTISGNVIKCDLVISNLASNMSIVGNEVFRMEISSLTSSTVSNNVFDYFYDSMSFGNLNESIVSENFFEASSLNLGSLTRASFIGNTVSASGSVSFSYLQYSKISDCIFTGLNNDMTIGYLENSTIDNCLIEGNLEISYALSGVLIGQSCISNSIIYGKVTLENTKEFGTVFENSIFESNTILPSFGNAITFTSLDVIFKNSHFNNNIVYGVAEFEITASSGTRHYVLEDSSFNNNVFKDAVSMDGNLNKITLVYNSSIDQNEFGGAVTIGTNLNASAVGQILKESSINGNICTSSLTLGPASRGATTITYLNSTISDNIIPGAFYINGAISSCVVSQNVTNDDVTIDQIYNTNFVGNQISVGDPTKVLDVNSIVESSVFSGNHVAGLFLIGSVANSNISSNTLLRDIQVTGTTASSVINNNQINGDTSTSLAVKFTGAVTESSFSDNQVSQNIEFVTSVSDSVVSNNAVDITKNINFYGGSLTSCSICGNVCKWIYVTASSSDTVTFSGNRIAQLILNSPLSKENLSITGNVCSLSIDGPTSMLIESQIVGNTLLHLDINSPMSMCSIGSNYVYIGADFALAVSRSTISSNAFAGGLTLASFDKSTFSGNRFGDTVSVSGGITETSVSDNVFERAFNVTGTIEDTIISGNTISANLTLNSSFGNLNNCIILDNMFSQITTGSWVGVVFSDNVVLSTASLAATLGKVVLNASMSSNVFKNNVTMGYNGVTNLSFVGNYCEDLFNFSSGVNTSTLSNNTLKNGITLGGTLNNSVFNNNVINHAPIFSNGISSSDFSNNILALPSDQNFTVSSTGGRGLDSVTFVGNRISCQKVFFSEKTYNSTISDNSFVVNDTPGLNFGVYENDGVSMEYSTFSGNSISTDVAFSGDIENSKIISNRFDAELDLATHTITGSKISDNTFTGAVEMEGIFGSTWVGNEMESSFTVYNDASVGNLASDLVFNNNICLGLVKFSHGPNRFNSNADSLTDVSISNNVLKYGLQLGYSSADAHNWTRCVINGNTGDRDWNLYIDGISGVRQVLIIGNNISGGFNTLLGSGGWDLPNTGTNSQMALNFFTAYNLNGGTVNNVTSMGHGTTYPGTGSVYPTNKIGV